VYHFRYFDSFVSIERNKIMTTAFPIASAPITDAALTQHVLRNAVQGALHVKPVAGSSFYHRLALGCASSALFLQALLFIPAFVIEHTEIAESVRQQAKDIHDIVAGAAIRIAHTQALEQNAVMRDFMSGIDRLVEFLAKSDSLSRKEVIALITDALPPTL
jgi:hypothetical protein